ncbi:MAG: hypothetical protein AAFN07_00855 [Pseudomonadota bacterium]
MSTPDSQHMDDLVTKYLSGRMSEAEAASFEEKYMDDDVLLDHLETAWVMREGLKRAERAEEPQQSAAWKWAAAAGLVAAIGLSVVTFRQSTEIRQLREVAVTGSSALERSVIARISPLRSSEETATVVMLDYDMATAVIVLELTLPEATEFAVLIKSADGATAGFDLEAVPVQGIGDLVFLVPTSALPPGAYEATASAGGQEQFTFRFDVKALHKD